MDKIAVLIPCYNESKTIEKVVTDFKKVLPEAVIYVYDNNSTEPICVEWKYITDYFVTEKIKEAIINEQD